MDERARIIKSSKNHNVTLKAVLGHFATNHSHINYYIDMTHIKHFHKMTEEAAVTLADKYRHDTVVDTIICLDGCEMIGALMARELAKSEMMSINSQTDIAVIAPEFNSNGQMIFRDNLQHMIADKKIVLLLA
ncbi:MAG: orotate phosphoribosyltransferase, partial [Oscillospiraceae bacterium]